MPEKKSPRLRNVEKVKAPYLINEFPNEFGFNLGREIVYLLATKGKPVLEGSDWEEMFANCVGAEWKPSNVGLDDVVLGNCCWGTKTVKANVNLVTNYWTPFYAAFTSNCTGLTKSNDE
ncbi:hypothetical protein [Leptospira kirschneri]|uniref:hypothetical protein n=1 Tax=Leptospira kirschneri TaxID=29507 RepID=UPI0021C9237D|nr:hypothetical protein [Leptospira kirschneri]UML81082.1 hypothetical protein FH602_05435 [Leptospira kirschneri]